MTYYQENLTAYTFYPTGGVQGIKTLINYGALSGGVSNNTNIHITNYGTMGGVSSGNSVTIANYGEINLLTDNGKKYHFGRTNLTLQNYALKITQNPTTFNAFDGNATDNSHLVLSDIKSVKFADKHSKLILDFGSGFEFGAGYLFSKLVVDTNGTNALGVDFSRLVPKSDIYTLYKQGDYFIARLQPQHSAISNISKANIRTMNNFYTISNSMIYPRKSYHSQNLGKKNLSLRASEYERGNLFIKESLDSANPLKSYESFSYRNESINRRIQRQNKRNYSRQPRNLSQNLNVDSANETNKTNQHNLRDSANQQSSSLRADSQNLRGNPQTQRTSQNQSQNSHDYYFILTPFFNHNLFFESGRYNLSGFEYGFLTAFSGKLNNINALGVHFGFSYGSLKDNDTTKRKGDKEFNITSMNLMLGLNYKLDLIWDSYIKARADVFYFFNQIKSLTIFENLKPNNLGFGVSVAYGKDFDFKQYGVLGLEVGIDYKALNTTSITLSNNGDKSINEVYNKALYNMLYVDLGLNYDKYFNTSIGKWGIDTGLGLKTNVTNNVLSTSKVIINNRDNIKMTIDNDLVLAYLNIAGSYLFESKDFDMEFSLAYYGNYGDRVISNGGGVEWRVTF